MRSRGGPQLPAGRSWSVPITSFLRRAAHVFRASTIPAAAATVAVSIAGTLAILGIANEALYKKGGATFRPPAAIAQAESPPVALRIPVLAEPSQTPAAGAQSSPVDIAPAKSDAPPPNSEPQPEPQPNPPPPDSPACEAPIIGEIPPLPVIGCLLDGLPL
jgi:hypothetical protein